MSSLAVRPEESGSFIQRVEERTAEALACGALLPVQAETVALECGQMNFVLRHVKALDQKQAMPGGPRDPNFNPFLPPDPVLTVGPIGTAHTVILNKFPVCEQHLVLARQAFAEQRTALELVDFRALAEIMSMEGGLGFHNGGAEAGASQRHKHVQWLPSRPDEPGLRSYRSVLDPDVRELTVFIHLQLPFRHCFVRVQAGRNCEPGASAASMLKGYQRALEILRLTPDEQGFLPPSNLLVEDGWMLVVPRKHEHFAGVSINALSFGGVFYVRTPEQVEALRSAGPLAALAAVSCAV